jgi:hypothetical protein
MSVGDKMRVLMSRSPWEWLEAGDTLVRMAFNAVEPSTSQGPLSNALCIGATVSIMFLLLMLAALPLITVYVIVMRFVTFLGECCGADPRHAKEKDM